MIVHLYRNLPAIFLLLVATSAGAGIKNHGKKVEKEDFAEQWKWAISVLPCLSGYQPLDLGGPPIEELRKWVPPGKSIVVYDERCRPIRVSLHEGVLNGNTEVRTTYRKGVKKVEALTVEYGATIAYLGPGWTKYEKDDKGKWVEVGGGGMGCLQTRPGTLNRVTKNAAWYEGIIVALDVVCASPIEKTESCIGGGSRICKLCTSLRCKVRSLSPGFGFGSIGTASVGIHPSEPVDCSIPCHPLDEKAKEMEKLNRILEGRKFLTTESRGGAPTLFRTRKECKRHQVKKRELL